MTNQKSILVRLTQDQHAQVQARAKAAGLSVNQYAVKAMLCESPALTPDEAIRGAEAALERALAALRSPAPVKTETAQEITEAPVEAPIELVVEAVVEPVVVAPVVPPVPEIVKVRLETPFTTDLQTLVTPKTSLSASEVSGSITPISPFFLLPKKVDSTKNGLFALEGEKGFVDQQKRLAVGAPVVLVASWSVPYKGIQGGKKATTTTRLALCGVVDFEDYIEWEKAFETSSQGIDLQEWVKEKLGQGKVEEPFAFDLDSITV